VRETRFTWWWEAVDKPNSNCAMPFIITEWKSQPRKNTTASDNLLAPARGDARPTKSPSISRRLFARPNQVEDFAFERPVPDATAKFFSERILLHIEPFLGIALAITQPMMPARD